MIITFVHGLRQGEDAWGLLKDSICNAFQAQGSEPIYSSHLRTRSNLDRAAQLLITELEAAADRDPSAELVIVGYSLGGLVAREAMRLLLETPRNGDLLLNRIEGIVTLGTPLHGATRNNAARFFGRWLPWLQVIGAQASDLKIDYSTAIEVSKVRSARRPKFYHVEFEEDEWSHAHNQELYTEDDNPAGVLSGSHTPLSTGERAKKVSDTVIRLIRGMRGQPKALAGSVQGVPATIAAQPAPALAAAQPAPAPAAAAAQPAQAPVATQPAPAPGLASPAPASAFDSIILAACSNSKMSGGEPHRPPLPGAWLSDGKLAERLLAKRATILDKLQAYQIQDQTYSQGNRGDRTQNRELVRGPDFGFTTTEPVYRPAIERYRGRFYAPLADLDWDELHARPTRPLILIMSGLYGFVQSNEMIQEYDAHTSDMDLSSATPLWSLWTDWLTPALNNALLPFGRKIPIINLLGDNDYVKAIQWADLDSSRCSIFHLISDQWENIDLLVPAGIILSGLINNPQLLTSLERATPEDKRSYSLSMFGAAPPKYVGTRIAFERRVGDMKDVMDWSSS